MVAVDGRVLARLCLLGGVPEHGPVTGPRRGVGRHNKGVMFDALLAGVIVDEAGALVRDFDTRTIGCRCRRATTGGTASRLHRKMDTRHRRPLPFPSVSMARAQARWGSGESPDPRKPQL